MTRSTRLLAPATLLVLVPVVAVTASILTSGDGATEPLSQWWLLAARAVHDVAAALTVGLLVVAATVLPGGGQRPGDLGGVVVRAVRIAAATGAVWVGAAAAVLVLTYREAVGTDAPSVSLIRQIVVFVRDFDSGRSLAASLALAVVTVLGAAVATRLSTVGALAVISIAAMLPLALGGHSAGAGNHAAAVDTLAAHLVGVVVWVGGLAALLMLRSRLADEAADSLRRFSRLAGWCFGLVLVSGVVGALLRLGGWPSPRTAYGALVLAKTTLLVALGAMGWWQRRRVIARLEVLPHVPGRLFARFAGGEIALMAAAMGLAVALGRLEPPEPAGEVSPSRAAVLLGYPMPPPLTAWRWVTEYRVDALWTAIAAVAVCWYLVSARRLRRRGDRWPVGRTAAWLTGWGLATWALSGAPGAYGSVLFSMHMVQHMTIAMAAPVFLVLGAPVSLALRVLPVRRDGSRGPREWLLAAVHSRLLGVLGHPLVAAGLFLAGLVVFYYSPLFELALRTHTGHVLMTAHFLFTGYLFASAICGVDPGPARPPYIFRLLLLVTTIGFHAFFGVAMMGSRTILAESWFGSLGRTWGNTLAQEQNLGGALAWALGDYPVAILVIAMGVQWVRADSRESRRFDRQANRDGDAQLAAYNERLRRLADAARSRIPG